MVISYIIYTPHSVIFVTLNHIPWYWSLVT